MALAQFPSILHVEKSCSRPKKNAKKTRLVGNEPSITVVMTVSKHSLTLPNHNPKVTEVASELNAAKGNSQLVGTIKMPTRYEQPS